MLYLGLLVLTGLTSFCFYNGYQKILALSTQIGDVAVYSRFDLAMIPFGFVLLGGLISALFFAFKKKRWDEVYGNGLQYVILGSLAVAIVLTLITPSIYQARYENAGLKECSRSPRKLPTILRN
ncbi:hypothetical protein D0856_04085 [Vibrio owensii]|uniref:hypothetical protein n=1 Tax=Vibrio owensii TaxID=696485 RepID=UPI000EFD4478|nr:hypothetical protein [Vibrio owensii]AYO19392.1 hypothetical protein D0856_04085 [Vibrio owensii]